MTIHQLPNLDSVSEMLAYALAVENEAKARYTEMADAMEAHNNNEVARLFREMSDIEQRHAGDIEQQAVKLGITELPPLNYQWAAPQGPETGDFVDLHYLMTPREALLLALHNEKKAAAFFAEIAKRASNPEVKAMAEDMASEEKEHVEMVSEWLLDFPEDEGKAT